jgi:hypothetical protein
MGGQHRKDESGEWIIPGAAAALVGGAAVATWWLAGNQSTLPPDTGPDYLIGPLPLSPVIERDAGRGCMIVAGAAVAVLR